MRPVRGPTFEDWAGPEDGSGPPNLADQLPFQRWQRFPEAFSPHLVRRAVWESRDRGLRVDGILDPFGGSGTTALAAQFLGLPGVTIEVNPFLADLIRAKTCRYEPQELMAAIHRAHSYVEEPLLPDEIGEEWALLPDGLSADPGLAQAFRALTAYRAFLDRDPGEEQRRLLRVALAAVAGRMLRLPTRIAAERRPTDSLRRRVSALLAVVLGDLEKFQDRLDTGFKVITGDARELDQGAGAYSLVVCSPPYLTFRDYTDSYLVELVAGGYVRTRLELQALRGATLKSHDKAKREDHAGRGASSSDGILESYVTDIGKVLDRALQGMSAPGRLYLVLADPIVDHAPCRLSPWVTAIAKRSGFRLVSEEQFRSLHQPVEAIEGRRLGEVLYICETA